MESTLRRAPALLPVACLLLALAACGGGGGGGGSTSGGSTGGGGGAQSGGSVPLNSVSGTVTFNGAPLAGATVTAFNTNTNSVFQVATTDASGQYTISGMLPLSNTPQDYQLWASKPGYGFTATVGSGASVIRQDYTGQYNTINGIYKTVIDFVSMPNGSIGSANFQALDGASPLVQVAATGQATSYVAGDDGALRTGHVAVAPRFVDNGNGTVLDTLTGLTWLKDAGCLGGGNWATALARAAQLASGACNLADGSTAGQWRLPNINELASLVDAERTNPALPAAHPFANVGNGTYWSSSTYFGLATDAWALRLGDGRYMNDGVVNDKQSASAAVWAVRGAGSGAGRLAATGQFVSYAAGDDGALRAGVRLSFPRWIDAGNGTVRDTVTGLTWLKRANCIHQPWAGAVTTVRALASGQCGLSDGSVAGDWRMPSRNELMSLADRALGNHADFFDWDYVGVTNVGNQPAIFASLVVSEFYWSSTTDAADPTRAWTAYSCDFGTYDIPKTDVGYTLAVR